MATDLEQLLDFGFEEKRAKKALKKGGNLQGALDWLTENENDNGDDDAPETNKASGDDDDDAMQIPNMGVEAKSLRCADCGKIFRNTMEAQWHGEKSGHSNFEESAEEKAPLTEAEKQQKLAELREKAAARKADNAVKEAEERKRNEEIRRKGGKELGQIKEEMKLKEAQKEAEARKREKIEDAKARQKIKQQIEEDKRVRREKEALEKALRDGTALPDAATNQASNVQKPTAAISAPAAAATNSARLQIRLPSGPPLTTTRPADDTLQSVLTWVQEQAPAIALQGSVMTTYPRKTYEAADFKKTLKELGLTPSSVLVIS